MDQERFSASEEKLGKWHRKGQTGSEKETQRLDLKPGVGERNWSVSIQFRQIYNALLSDV